MRRSTRSISSTPASKSSMAPTATRCALRRASCRPSMRSGRSRCTSCRRACSIANPLNRYLINSPMLPSLEARRRRRDHAVRPERVARRRQGGELAARAEGAVLRGVAAVLAEARGAERQMEGATAAAGELNTRGEQSMKTKSYALRLGVGARCDQRRSRAVARAGNAVPVTVDNFIRAESDLYFGGILKDSGAHREILASPRTGADRQSDRHPSQPRHALFVGRVRPRRGTGHDHAS